MPFTLCPTLLYLCEEKQHKIFARGPDLDLQYKVLVKFCKFTFSEMAGQEDQKRHWVENVFRPTFGFTAGELYERDHEHDEKMSKEDKSVKNVGKRSSSVYDMVAHRYVYTWVIHM